MPAYIISRRDPNHVGDNTSSNPTRREKQRHQKRCEARPSSPTVEIVEHHQD